MKRTISLTVFLMIMLCMLTCFSVSAAEEKWILMGDSYASRLKGKNFEGDREQLLFAWPDYVTDRLHKKSLIVRLPGTGFCKPDPTHNETFYSAASKLTADKNVTRFVLVGGIGNDLRCTGGPASRKQIETAMSAFHKLVKSKFPNAQIVISMPNWGIATARQSYIKSRVNWYYTKPEALGWKALRGSENVLRVKNLKKFFFDDGIHPNVYGQWRLGQVLTKYLKELGEAPAAKKITSEETKPAAQTVIKKNPVILPRMTKVTSDSITLRWNAVEGAVKYCIYGNKFNSATKKIGMVLAPETGSVRKNLSSGTYYKFRVEAYDKGNKLLAKSRELHIVTPKSKYTNCKKVTVNKTSLSLQAGKSGTISATETMSVPGNPTFPSSVVYISDTPAVATVSASGVVKGLNKGKCKIYAVAQTGVYAVVNIVVS